VRLLSTSATHDQFCPARQAQFRQCSRHGKIRYDGDSGSGSVSGGDDVVLYDFVNAQRLPAGTMIIIR
jgi:hypothetical protein